MRPSGNGRFCDHCQKTVIDFSGCSDEELYAFFSKQKDTVCGRFRVSQTRRHINIPPQPHSQLYKMVVAFGLTLVFTQGTYAQTNAPLVPTMQVNAKDSVKAGSNPGVVIADSVTLRISDIVHQEIYSMGAVPPNIAVIPKVWVTNSVYTFSNPLNGKVPLPKQIKGITIPKLRKP